MGNRLTSWANLLSRVALAPELDLKRENPVKKYSYPMQMPKS
jgi:hypothetical protein